MFLRIQMLVFCATLLLVSVSLDGQAQLLDRLLNMKPLDGADSNKINLQADSSQPVNTGEIGQTFKRIMNSLHSVNIPAIYEMNKNGSSMGINVLSGLVRVEKGAEAERNGLTGSRPLSVRVFGVPVYDRGHRVRQPSSEGNGLEPFLTSIGSVAGGKGTAGGKPETNNDDEELPIEV